MKHILLTLTALLFSPLSALQTAETDAPIDIGSRRELFVDDYLIGSLRDARRQLHHPTPREIAIAHDAPWEGAGSAYHSVIRDGDLYRLYYRGSALGVENGRLRIGREVYCYAESRDGITFTKPELGLHDYNGSKRNNIIWTGVGAHNFATSAAGDIHIEIQDADGNPLAGFTLDDCSPIFGDSLERTVTWNGASDVSRLVGKPIRLRFVLRDADLYSFRFHDSRINQ